MESLDDLKSQNQTIQRKLDDLAKQAESKIHSRRRQLSVPPQPLRAPLSSLGCCDTLVRC